MPPKQQRPDNQSYKLSRQPQARQPAVNRTTTVPTPPNPPPRHPDGNAKTRRNAARQAAKAAKAQNLAKIDTSNLDSRQSASLAETSKDDIIDSAVIVSDQQRLGELTAVSSEANLNLINNQGAASHSSTHDIGDVKTAACSVKVGSSNQRSKDLWYNKILTWDIRTTLSSRNGTPTCRSRSVSNTRDNVTEWLNSEALIRYPKEPRISLFANVPSAYVDPANYVHSVISTVAHSQPPSNHNCSSRVQEQLSSPHNKLPAAGQSLARSTRQSSPPQQSTTSAAPPEATTFRPFAPASQAPRTSYADKVQATSVNVRPPQHSTPSVAPSQTANGRPSYAAKVKARLVNVRPPQHSAPSVDPSQSASGPSNAAKVQATSVKVCPPQVSTPSVAPSQTGNAPSYAAKVQVTSINVRPPEQSTRPSVTTPAATAPTPLPEFPSQAPPTQANPSQQASSTPLAPILSQGPVYGPPPAGFHYYYGPPPPGFVPVVYYPPNVSFPLYPTYTRPDIYGYGRSQMDFNYHVNGQPCNCVHHHHYEMPQSAPMGSSFQRPL
ncbi:hypothetical protein HDU76_003384 [Blyttiomyces sp. JEL0837]|nr:hypothetical protein HDU76_003384 [Blyttiomyces sp. JEL0837]